MLSCANLHFLLDYNVITNSTNVTDRRTDVMIVAQARHSNPACPASTAVQRPDQVSFESEKLDVPHTSPVFFVGPRLTTIAPLW